MMGRLEGSRSHRRTKCYLVEALVPDLELVFDYDEEGFDVDVVSVDRPINFPVLAHGPEQAVRRVRGLHIHNVQAVRRIRNVGLLRAILTPDDEYFDLHRGELEEDQGL